MIIARQSTARTVTVGPVLDADGVAVTGCVVGDFKIAKNGAAPAALNASATLTHRHTGFYSLALTASDLDTVGTAEVTIDDTVNACQVKELQVIEEAAYDLLFAASATAAVTVTAFTGAADTQIDAIEAAAINVTSYMDQKLGTSSFSSPGSTMFDFLRAIMRSDVATPGQIGGTYSPASDSLEALRDRGDEAWITATGFSTLTAAGVRAAVGLASANLDTQLGAIDDAIDTEIPAIKAVTDALSPRLPGSGTISTLTAAQVNTEVDTALADVGLTTVVTGRIDATVSSRLASASYTAAPTAAENAAGLLDLANGVEVGLTPRQAMRLMAAALAGELSGAATTTITIRNAVADSKDRIVATVDASGNRSAVTVDLT